MERILMFGANYRLVTFLLLAIVTAFCAQGLQKLSIDTGFESLIPDSNPDRQAYLRVSEEFGSDNRTLIYIRDPALWTPSKLIALQRLQDSLEHLEFVERADSIVTLRTVRGQGKTLDSRPLLQGKLRDAEAIKQARDDALANPLIVGNYVSEDGNATTMMVTVVAIVFAIRFIVHLP